MAWAKQPLEVKLPSSSPEPDVAQGMQQFSAAYTLPAESFARMVVVVISQPDEVAVNEILFRPTRQELYAHPGRIAFPRSTPMEITRSGAQASGKGPADYFTGAVRVDPLFQAPDPARVRGASVTFEPGARTAWHTHPLGQTLIVTAGCGLAQRWGGPIEPIRPGDVVWFPPGEKHWHGATATTAMTHIAIVEHLDGTSAVWMEPVSDEQYHAQPSPTL